MSRKRAHSPPTIDQERLGDGAAIAVWALLVCAGVVRNGFAQDDVSIIQESDRLHGFGAWHDILTLPYWPPPASPDLYRPVTSLWLSLQYAIGGDSPSIYHAVSIALFAGVAIMFYSLARRLLPRMPALVAAAVFASHPVHVEAIALAVGQAELLVGLIALWCAMKYVDWRQSGTSLTPGQWATLCAVYIVAAFSKENGLVIPALLASAELLPIQNESARSRIALLWKGYLAMAMAAMAVILVRTAVLSHLAASIAADAIRDASLGQRVLTMFRTAPEWFRLFAWPTHLRAEYSPQEFVPSSGIGLRESLGILLIIGAVSAIVLLRKRAPALSFALAWTAIGLVPVANVVLPSGILIAERTLFLPSVGPCLIAGVVAQLLLHSVSGRETMRRVVLAGCAAIAVALGVRSVSRFRVWQSNRSLTRYSMVDSPRSWRVQQAYAELLFDEGRLSEGSAAFERAIQYAPETWRPRNRFAERLLQTRRDEEALEQLQRSLAENPGRIETYIRLPAALLAVGDYERARALADSIIVAENSPPIMVGYRAVADSAMKLKAPAGSVRVFPF